MVDVSQQWIFSNHNVAAFYFIFGPPKVPAEISVVNFGKIRVNPHISFLKCFPLNSWLIMPCISVRVAIAHTFFQDVLCMPKRFQKACLIAPNIFCCISRVSKAIKKTQNFEVEIIFFLDIWPTYSFQEYVGIRKAGLDQISEPTLSRLLTFEV